MQFQFRKANEADLEKIRLLDSECFPVGSLDLEPAAPGELEAGVQNGEILLALCDSEIVGMIQLHNSSSDSELLSLAITKDFRGMGLGKSLMSQILNQWSTESASLTCVTSPNNLAMRALLESFGFLEQAEIRDHFGEGKHRLLYRLDSHPA